MDLKINVNPKADLVTKTMGSMGIGVAFIVLLLFLIPTTIVRGILLGIWGAITYLDEV